MVRMLFFFAAFLARRGSNPVLTRVHGTQQQWHAQRDAGKTNLLSYGDDSSKCHVYVRRELGVISRAARPASRAELTEAECGSAN